MDLRAAQTQRSSLKSKESHPPDIRWRIEEQMEVLHAEHCRDQAELEHLTSQCDGPRGCVNMSSLECNGAAVSAFTMIGNLRAAEVAYNALGNNFTKASH